MKLNKSALMRFCKLLTAAAMFATLSSNFAQDVKVDAGDWPWAKYGIPKTDAKTCIPVPRTEDWAIQCHTQAIKMKNPSIRVAFLGDSITHGFQFQKVPDGVVSAWNEYCGPLGSANFGIPGDKTQHVLWRITEGGLLDDKLKPKVLVILIGINNLYASSDSPDDVAKAITLIVNCAKAKLPDTKILLLGIFPCFNVTHVGTVGAQATNAIVSKLHDGKKVFYLDIGDRFIEPDKSISKEKLRDGLHPSEKGNRIWAEAMRPYLDDLLNNDGKGEIWKNAGLKTIAAEVKAGAKAEPKTDDKNLLRNGNLDEGDGAHTPGWIFSKWQLKDGSPEAKAVEWGNVKEADGNRCLRIATTDQVKTYIWFQQEILCEPAQSYSLSFRSKASPSPVKDGTRYASLFYLIDKDGKWIGAPETIPVEWSGEWKTWTAKTTTPENAVKLGVRIGVSFDGKAEAFFDNIILNK
ncbi:MAG: GDSL-type esterase/lipase family protein [Victivallales bacterium]